jgi:hypothetical protein
LAGRISVIKVVFSVAKETRKPKKELLDLIEETGRSQQGFYLN